jgi:hypothetical protein
MQNLLTEPVYHPYANRRILTGFDEHRTAGIKPALAAALQNS